MRLCVLRFDLLQRVTNDWSHGTLKQPAVFLRGLLPSRLRRWRWKACDAAGDVVRALTFVSAIAVVAFLAYMLVVSAASAMFG